MKKAEKIWNDSQKYIPGGVNSPVRAYKSVGRKPLIIKEGKGCYIFDQEGRSYLDFVNSWGPLILGHSPKPVVKAIRKQLKKGTSFGAATEVEMQLAKLIVKNIDFIDQIRFVSSGTEAVMSALRLARGFTGREKIIKFSGCYHGHVDSLLVNAGSGLLTFSGDISEASSKGIPKGTAQDTLSLPLGDLAIVERALEQYKDQVAALIIEPLPANSGLLKQDTNFLQGLRNLCDKHKSLLIFDEVISGFRLGFSGFAGKYGIAPDIVTYGKIIGGGLPVGAFASRKEIMQELAPIGDIYQAGTLSGNPLAMRSGLITLETLLKNNGYKKLSNLEQKLKKEFNKKIALILEKKNFIINLVQEDSIFWMSFSNDKNSEAPSQVEQIAPEGAVIYQKLFKNLLKYGVHLAPSSYEVGFLSMAMTNKEIEVFISSLKKAINSLE